MKRKYAIYFILIIIGIISMISYAYFPKITTAQILFSQSPTTIFLSNSSAENQLPIAVKTAVLQAAATHTGLPESALKIIAVETKTWPDGCLGLSIPNVFCTQALVEGWQITLIQGQQRLIYRSDSQGNIVYLEPATIALPRNVEKAVLRTIQRQFKIPLSRLKITEVQEMVWDGCLGIAEPETICTQIAIKGWHIVVEGKQQRWVYHSNYDGSQIKFNAADSNISQVNSLRPRHIPKEEMPSSLPQGVVFRMTSEGGIMGDVSEVILREDGRLIRKSLRLNNEQTWQISRQQIRKFQEVLRQEHFSRYNRLSYPEPPGSADFFVITLASPNVVTRYVDINQDQLPQPLQTIITNWQELIQNASKS